MMITRPSSRICSALRAIAIACLLTLSLPLNAVGVAAAQDQPRVLEGSWRVQVSIVDCTTGAALAPPFWSLLSFARGGTLTETTANQMLPAPRTPGHGVWAWTGPGTFAAASEAFLLFGALNAPWTQRIDQSIAMVSDTEFASEARVTFSVTPSAFPPVQAPPPPGCARARGFRF